MFTKHLFDKETHSFQFTEETRNKVADFLFELTGLKDITEVTIKPNGMYVETIKIIKEDGADA